MDQGIFSIITLVVVIVVIVAFVVFTVLQYNKDKKAKDKKIQTKDPFFHNANSIIKKKLWKKFKFDEKTNHIEEFGQSYLKKTTTSVQTIGENGTILE